MTNIKDAMSATCEYVHKKANGNIISSGKIKIDWLGRTHIIQKKKNGEIIESIFNPGGALLKTQTKIPLYVRFLRLVGLQKK